MLSFVLDEKTALGLAESPPPEEGKVPVELLDIDALEQRALESWMS